MFLSAKLILKGNTVDVYFYLQTGMVGLDFEKKLQTGLVGLDLKINKIWTGPKKNSPC
jgi:hypothetical protein